MAELPSGTVTFLFTDIEGSTSLWEEHAEGMRDALARHDEILRDAVESNGGYAVKTTGDGIHAAFGTATDGLGAAIAGQRALGAEPWPAATPLRVRMGLHTGSAELRGGDYYGPSLNRAARLMAAGHGGQLLVSNASEELVRDELPEGVELVDLGSHRLRDLARPDRVFQVRAAGISDRFPPLRSLDAFPGNLPVQLTSFVAREDELKSLADALRTSRLVTLTGVGGVGKTRLATQLAADLVPEYQDGAWVCELAGAADGESMVQLVAATIGAQPRTGLPLEQSVFEFLRSKQLLLLLDNCEHVLDAAGDLAEGVLAACPHVRVLATSREGLAVRGEQVWPLRALSVPKKTASGDAAVSSDSVQLFAERARAARPAFEVDASNAAAVAEICRRLDGMPLAIELAAARVAAMSPLEISRRLDERFRLLTGGRRTVVERHQTLRATVDWSYSLLEERDRLVFDRLGVFVGGFDAEAAEAVTSGGGIEDWDILDALSDLVAKSLVVPDETADGVTRYEMLETLRHYARERLDEREDADSWRRRHGAYFADFADTAGAAIRGPDELAWRRRLRTELDNLRSAVIWSLDSNADDDGELALRIICALAPQEQFDPTLGIGEWAVGALGRAQRSTPGHRYGVVATAAYRAAVSGNFERSRALALESLEGGVPPDAQWPALAAVTLGFLDANSAQVKVALQRYEGAIEELGDRIDAVQASGLYGSAGATASWAGDVTRARELAEFGLRIGRESGNPSAIASGLFCVGVALRVQDPAAARAALEECISVVEDGATPVVYGYALGAVARLRAKDGELEGALGALRSALRYAIDSGNESLQAQLRGEAIPVLVEIDEPSVAAILLAGMPFSPREITSDAHPLSEAADWTATILRTRSALGDAAFEGATSMGASMSQREAVDYAIGELNRIVGELASR